MDAFDFTLRRMDDGGLDKLWSIISAIGLWVNCEGVEQLISKNPTFIDQIVTDDINQTLMTVRAAGC